MRLDELDVLLLCHPNNPTGTTFSREQLQDWRARLASRGGWLVLDEAFMDATPEHSLLGDVGLPGLIVLRSVGKFFGLAGARVGFVFAWPALLQQLAEAIGPWSINGPAREVVKLALQDSNWQQAMRGQLAATASACSSYCKTTA
jgi:cobalamin biosynthetic protein CobC